MIKDISNSEELTFEMQKLIEDIDNIKIDSDLYESIVRELIEV